MLLPRSSDIFNSSFSKGIGRYEPNFLNKDKEANTNTNDT